MISEKAKLFTESVIRQMTHLCHQYDAINLAQGYPDFEAPSELKESAIQAINAGHNQYGLTWGSQTFRLLLNILTQADFQCYVPEGAYYIMTDIFNFGFSDDVAFAHWLAKKIGVGVVPGSSFYHRAELGRQQVRFTFSKTDETLRAAGERLLRINRKETVFHTHDTVIPY